MSAQFYLWMILSGLCIAQGISKMPKTEKPEHPYHSRVIFSTKGGGIGATTLFTKWPVTTDDRFNELQNFIRKQNPDLENLFITNIIKLDGY